MREKYHNDPFYAAFEQGILSGIQNSQILPEDNFNLICDDSEEHAGDCLKVFRRFMRDNPETAKRIGTICFGDDEKITPLQMSDMFAYCLRKDAEKAPDGIWREILDIFTKQREPAEWRPVVIHSESRWRLFRRRWSLLMRDAKRMFRGT